MRGDDRERNGESWAERPPLAALAMMPALRAENDALLYIGELGPER
jgi:hypothetical protein